MVSRRLFIAIPFTADVSPVIADLAELGRPIRTVKSDHQHLTLRFLGDTNEALLAQLKEVLNETAATESPFDISCQGLGAFPKLARPSVVWAGVRPAEPCMRLEKTLTTLLAPLGFEPEGRAYRPHLTLARVKGRPPAGLSEFLSGHCETEFATMHVAEISLFESTLTPAGAIYAKLASAPLGATPKPADV